MAQQSEEDYNTEALADAGVAPLAPWIPMSLFDVLDASPKEEKGDEDTPSPGSADGISIDNIEFPDDNLASYDPPQATRTVTFGVFQPLEAGSFADWVPLDEERVDALLPDALDDDFSPPHLPPSDDHDLANAHFFDGDQWANLSPEQVAAFKSVYCYAQSELEAAWKSDNMGRGYVHSPESFAALPRVQGWLQDDTFGPNLRAGGRKVHVVRRGSDPLTEEQLQAMLASIVFDDVSVPMPASARAPVLASEPARAPVLAPKSASEPASEPARAPVLAPVRASKRKVGAPPTFALLGEWEFSEITKPEPKRKKAYKQVAVPVEPASKQVEVKHSLRRREVNPLRGASPFRRV